MHKLQEFSDDHMDHIRKFFELLKANGDKMPNNPSTTKQWITKGKVIIADMVSDESILKAMNSDEVNTNTALRYDH